MMDGGPAAAGQVGAYTRQHLILDRPGLLPFVFFFFLNHLRSAQGVFP